MADIKLRFAADAPPLSVIATAKLAGIPITEEATLSSGSDPTLLLPDGSKLNGTNPILRYLSQIAKNIPNMYGRRNDFESAEIDQWLEYARDFKFETRAIIHLDAYLELEHRRFLVGNSLSIADLAVWSNLAVTGSRWVAVRLSGVYPLLGLWFTSISLAHGAVLNEVIKKYVGERHSGKSKAPLDRKDA